MVLTKKEWSTFMIHSCTIALSCSQALDRHAAVSVGNNAISCHSGGRETIRTEINWAEIHSGNVPVTGSGCIWLDAHTTRLVSVTDQWKGSWVMLSFLEVICVRRDKDACQSQEKELEIQMNMLRVWISCFVLTYNHLFSYIYCSSLRCWITSWPLWSLSSMEWASFESTSPTARTRSALNSFHYTVEEYFYVCVYACMFFHLNVSSPVKLLFRLTVKKHCFCFIVCSTYRVH